MNEKDRCVSGGESIGEIRRDVAEAMDEVFTKDAELFDRLADASGSAHRARLYKPPPGLEPDRSRRQPGRMDRTQALRMAAELAEEDAGLTGRRRGTSE